MAYLGHFHVVQLLAPTACLPPVPQNTKPIPSSGQRRRGRDSVVGKCPWVHLVLLPGSQALASFWLGKQQPRGVNDLANTSLLCGRGSLKSRFTAIPAPRHGDLPAGPEMTLAMIRGPLPQEWSVQAVVEQGSLGVPCSAVLAPSEGQGKL